jgi:hypothetical protein
VPLLIAVSVTPLCIRCYAIDNNTKQTITRTAKADWAGERIVVGAEVERVELKLHAANTFLDKLNQDKNINPEQKEIVFTKLQNAKAAYKTKEVMMPLITIHMHYAYCSRNCLSKVLLWWYVFVCDGVQ